MKNKDRVWVTSIEKVREFKKNEKGTESVCVQRECERERERKIKRES